MSPREARAHVGYLGHEPQLYPRLSVRENLLFCARLYRTDESSASKLMHSVGLDEKRNSPAAELSRGELQRASLAKTLLHDPDVVLADEPFTALDEESIAALPGLLLREGRTIILATHDKDRAASLVDRIVTIKAGTITDRR
jgi:ABC-type multidrug transport system ATPase subunit